MRHKTCLYTRSEHNTKPALLSKASAGTIFLMMNKTLYQLKRIYTSFQNGAVFTAFDTETTGLRPVEDRIIEIGAVRFSKDGELGEFSTLVYPGVIIPRFCTELTGITTKMVYGQPTFGEIAPAFLEFSAGSTLIAHNCNFDITFMNAELERCNMKKLTPPLIPGVDTVRSSRAAFPDLGCWKLQFLAAHFGIPPGNAHRATDDARVCKEVFLKCLKAYEEAAAAH